MAAQVALKRQQAAEDAVAMGLRCISPYGQLPPGPVFVDEEQVDEDESDDDEGDVDEDDDEANGNLNENAQNDDTDSHGYESCKDQRSKINLKNDIGSKTQGVKRMRNNDENEGKF